MKWITNPPRELTEGPLDEKRRGKLQEEYEIYCEQLRSLGWEVKTFDEWLNS